MKFYFSRYVTLRISLHPLTTNKTFKRKKRARLYSSDNQSSSMTLITGNECQENMSLVVRKPVIRADTNRAVQSHKMVRGLKFGIWTVEVLYYLCSENKCADRVRSYCAADLRLCFRICIKPVFSQRGSYTAI